MKHLLNMSGAPHLAALSSHGALAMCDRHLHCK